MTNQAADNPLWFKDAIIYQAHVRSFFDSNADGIGDFKGLTKKLDYLEFLGITLIWILPFYPSPLKDDGYDIADFTTINPIYGDLNDFKTFLEEAHARNMKVMTELVLNHTSSEHPWFQRARKSPPESQWRNYYVWSDHPNKYQEARIIFKDFETSNWTWDPIANAYYWHRFYSHQPDLNYENPEVHEAMLNVMDFWLSMGVDGLRLDAVPYLYEKEGTHCENLPETHAFLKKIRKAIDERYPGRVLLAEANQWPEDAIAYFGDGDECQMAFHFPMMPRLYIAIQQEDSFPLLDILQQTPPIPDNCQWTTFLRNHDELTLEMVTDEERDYMYRFYAEDQQMRINLGIRRRLAPLMKADRRKIELMHGLLFSLPGTPVIYYGDEIGMGDNIYLGDRNGVRTPMQWNNDRNTGFSKANPQQLFLPVIIDPEFSYELVNVALQKQNQQSLLWWMKHLIELRKNHLAFGRGNIHFLSPENNKILAFLRIRNDEHLLIVANLSQHPQCASLDLSGYSGKRLTELFGGTAFAPIGENPYQITLSAYAFFYFKIEALEKNDSAGGFYQPPTMALNSPWEQFSIKQATLSLGQMLKNYLYSCRWFKSKSYTIYHVDIIDDIPLNSDDCLSHLFTINVSFKAAPSESYFLPICLLSAQKSEKIIQRYPQSLIAYIDSPDQSPAALLDALYVPEVALKFLELIQNSHELTGVVGKMVNRPIIDDLSEAQATSSQKQVSDDGLAKNDLPCLSINNVTFNVDDIHLASHDQSNTTINFAHQILLKFYRHMEKGTNPELEIGSFLNRHTNFKKTPPLLAHIDYTVGKQHTTLALASIFIPHQSDAWQYTLNAVSLFFETILAQPDNIQLPCPPSQLLGQIDESSLELAQNLLGSFSQSAFQLGECTAQMHLALASTTESNLFMPEPFTPFDQRGLSQSAQTGLHKVIQAFKGKINQIADADKPIIQAVLDNEANLYNHIKTIQTTPIGGQKIRCHGDCHLGQILFTGKDFIILDFEGEPKRALTERKLKKTPLKDVASLLRSFHYAVSTVVRKKFSHDPLHPILQISQFWYQWVCWIFLKGYLETTSTAAFLPSNTDQLLSLLRLCLLDRITYEILYEMNNRPEWISIPCVGLLEILSN